ncbi:hypothetical protein FHS54_003082 [Sphingobium vermicomposti]|uniref:Uncharacterized protein n=1 Tax=Sphingobium vermicomposti TaxID=529005 RepID=A0A846M876_9SPHN|nr:hypothetical protein [Sphingobium vermicomposti]
MGPNGVNGRPLTAYSCRGSAGFTRLPFSSPCEEPVALPLIVRAGAGRKLRIGHGPFAAHALPDQKSSSARHPTTLTP